MTPKEFLKNLIEENKTESAFFDSITVDSLNNARKRALESISYYKEIKKSLSEKEKRKELFNQCLQLIEKI